jgi:hypothetical protein
MEASYSGSDVTWYASGQLKPGPLSAQLRVNKCRGDRDLRLRGERRRRRPRTISPLPIAAHCGKLPSTRLQAHAGDGVLDNERVRIQFAALRADAAFPLAPSAWNGPGGIQPMEVFGTWVWNLQICREDGAFHWRIALRDESGVGGRGRHVISNLPA